MFLLTGPPAAGKTSYCLAALRACLRAKNTDVLLLVPTSTMAEHLRNQLAREGFVFSPRLVTTFGRFVNDLAPGLNPVSGGTLQLIVEQVLGGMSSGRYAAVKDYAGFRSALAGAIAEYAGAGGDASHLVLTGPDFAAAYEGVLAELKRRSLYLRSQRLAHAASKVADTKVPSQIWVTGFTGFTPPEALLLQSLSARSNLTVTLPHGSLPGVTSSRELHALESTVPRTVVVANTPDAEANEIARRILNENRPWREMGVIVRAGVMMPVLRAAFERFGIPARFYFAPPLFSDSTVRYLLALVDAALSGWEHERTVSALRMHGSPFETTGDRWEYMLRQAMPGSGLDALHAEAHERCHSFLDELAKITAWRDEQHTPRAWVVRFHTLPNLFQPQPVTDGVRSELWREQAAAIESFRAAVEETASSLEPTPTSCRQFVDALYTILQSASVRVRDRRRDVVHVIDAVEARQWRLPVVFVAGLLEGDFPKHHSENAILSDDVRRGLRAAGVEMKTSAERQVQEQELFDLVLTRATERTVLSYARLNGKGEANLPSFLLERAKPYAEELATAVRPRPVRRRSPEPLAIVESDELRAALALKHAQLSPSSIEMYANCAYSFFGLKSLRLKSAPDNPYDRLNMLVQGNIAHLAFEMHFRDATPIGEAFETAFRQHCRDENIPPGYRTEAVRLELQYGVEQLAAEPKARLRGARSLFEEPFQIDLGEGTIVNGRIDRLEIDERNNALIFDYKYRRAAKLRATLTENESGERVQTGMYLEGAKSLKLTPIGMAYCGFKKEVSVLGWVLPPHYAELGQTCSEEQLSEVITAARQTALQAANDIRNGIIAPEPVDVERCQWCELVSMCRYEVREATQIAGGTGAA